MTGQELLSKSFPAGASVPTDVVVPPRRQRGRRVGAAGGRDGVEAVTPPVAQGGEGTLIQATLEPQPYSTEAFDLSRADPRRGRRAPSRGRIVGGPTAVEFDLREASAWDST